MSNFPLGAALDINAPYNQKEVECHWCNGTGVDEDDDTECLQCEGSGVILKGSENDD